MVVVVSDVCVISDSTDANSLRFSHHDVSMITRLVQENMQTFSMCRGLKLTWPLLGRAGLAVAASEVTLSTADEGLAEEGLKSWRVALEGGLGWRHPSWGCWTWAVGE